MVESDPIYVFATNETGHHENELASLAVHRFGAKRSVGSGLVGRSYAIPVLNREGQRLASSRIIEEFQRFKEFAAANPSERFMLSRIGCDSIGFKDERVFGYFKDCPSNVDLPGVWRKRMDPSYQVLGITGSQKINMQDIVDDVLNIIVPLYSSFSPILKFVVGDEDGADFCAAKYLAQKDFDFEVVPTNWEHDGARAGAVRNRIMSHRCTHMVLFDDGECAKSAHMRRVISDEGVDLSNASVTIAAKVVDKEQSAERSKGLLAKMSL